MRGALEGALEGIGEGSSLSFARPRGQGLSCHAEQLERGDGESGEKVGCLRPQGVSGRKVIPRSSPLSRRAKNYLSSGYLGALRAGSGGFEDEGAAVAEGDLGSRMMRSGMGEIWPRDLLE